MPSGWPLTLGTGGLVLHLGELEASALRLGECYLCVRNAAATATAIATTLTVKTADSIEKDTVEVSHTLHSFDLLQNYNSLTSLPQIFDEYQIIFSDKIKKKLMHNLNIGYKFLINWK